MDRRNGFSPAQLEELAEIIAGHRFSDEQLQKITTEAAQKAVAMMTKDAYAAVGRTVVEKFLYLVGLLTVALGVWAASRGWIKLP